MPRRIKAVLKAKGAPTRYLQGVPNKVASDYLYIYIVTILPNVLGHPLLMKGLTTLVISMSTNLNVYAYNDSLGNCVLLTL